MYQGFYTAEQVLQIEANNLTLELVDKQWKMFSDQDLETVIGSLKMLENGQGQERNEPFLGEATGGVTGE